MRAVFPPASVIGQFGESPSEVAAKRAQAAAERAHVATATAFAHTGRAHPLQWTIERDWHAAQVAARAAATWPARAEVWRRAERRMQELSAVAMDREKRDAAVVAQQAEIAAIGEATIAASPKPPPAASAAAALLQRLRERGITLSVTAGKIVATPASAMMPREIEALRSLKAEILPLIRGDVVEV